MWFGLTGDELLLNVLAANPTDLVVNLPPVGCSHNNVKKCTNAIRELGFHAAAAFLNSVSAVAFELSPQDVIDLFNQAYENGDKATMETQKDYLDALNNRGSPYCD